MKRVVVSTLAILFLVSLSIGLLGGHRPPLQPGTADQIGLTAHEWGTFTSIAGENGQAVAWRTYGGPGDLPCFVHRFGGFKGGLFGNVRMETPVIYFYGANELAANVKVLFPKGTITEWYPNANLGHSYNLIEWRDLSIHPNAPAELPVERGLSHYYAARETDAALVRVGSQNERFLFYRGVGNIPLPISAKFMEGKIVINNLGSLPVDSVILFENRRGNHRYGLTGSLQGEITVDTESLQSNWAGLLMDLERILVDHGLYEKEARAMIETWRDSWFEEGTRVFYIIPKGAIDSILPLQIQPAPSQIARVFVGRMEIITPAIQDDVKEAITKNDRLALEKYGRFLEPIANRLGVKSALLDSIYSKEIGQNATCER
jgi:hypothetical protein